MNKFFLKKKKWWWGGAKSKSAITLLNTVKLLNLLTLFFYFFSLLLKWKEEIQLETCVFLVPLSSCNKHEKCMFNGQMAGTQNTHSKWRTVFHTTQTKSKQQTCCKQKQNNISHQHSRQREVTGKEAGKRTRKNWVFTPALPPRSCGSDEQRSRQPV